MEYDEVKKGQSLTGFSSENICSNNCCKAIDGNHLNAADVIAVAYMARLDRARRGRPLHWGYQDHKGFMPAMTLLSQAAAQSSLWRPQPDSPGRCPPWLDLDQASWLAPHVQTSVSCSSIKFIYYVFIFFYFFAWEVRVKAHLLSLWLWIVVMRTSIYSL